MGRMQAVADRTTLLEQASQDAECIFRSAADLEAEADAVSLRGSPLNPMWINEADSLLFLNLRHTAFIFGGTTGTGFIISRLHTGHPSLIRWSAPCFVTVSLRCLGLSFGRQTSQSFVACMTPQMRHTLSQRGERRIVGLEATINFGGLQHKPDLIAAATDDMGTVGINCTSGALVELSFSVGSLKVDAPKNALIYGPAVTPLQLLHGTQEAPREMQPLFGALNQVLGTVERVTPPARVSASLERYTAGFDPDRRMVLPNGTVVREDLLEPPKDK